MQCIVTVTAIFEAPSRPTVYDSRSNDADAASGGNQSDEELDLLFDPQLQCFYDPRTFKYYKLIM